MLFLAGFQQSITGFDNNRQCPLRPAITTISGLRIYFSPVRILKICSFGFYVILRDRNALQLLLFDHKFGGFFKNFIEFVLIQTFSFGHYSHLLSTQLLYHTNEFKSIGSRQHKNSRLRKEPAEKTMWSVPRAADQYMPPPCAAAIAAAFAASACGSGLSVTRLSVVRTMAATEEAFSSAERVTFVGSRMPA